MFYKLTNKIQIIIIILFVLISNTNQLHITGKYKISEFFKLLTRFGFQSTDVHNKQLARATAAMRCSAKSATRCALLL